jgi:hypothetical protein
VSEARSKIPDSIEKLYLKFGKMFKKPLVFDNDVCCVSKKQAKYLLATKLREIGEQEVSHALNHYRNCFGTFEQVMYLFPRLLEIAAETKGRLGYCHCLFSLLSDEKKRLEELGMWQVVFLAMEDIYGSEDCMDSYDREEWQEFKRVHCQ